MYYVWLFGHGPAGLEPGTDSARAFPFLGNYVEFRPDGITTYP